MPATAATIGFGTAFAIGDGAGSEVFTAVAEVTDLTPPGRSRDTHEATNFASPNGYKEFIGGLRDGGEVTVQCNYTDAGYTALSTRFEAASGGNFKITFPNTATLVWGGVPTALDMTDPLNGVRQMSFKVKVTGKPTFTAGT